MGADKPGWYYVGNDQFRYMDVDGWTDQYKPKDGAKAPDAETAPAPPVPLEPVTRASVRGQDAPGPSPFIKLCSTAAHRLIAVLTPLIVAAWRLITTGYRDASSSLSKQAVRRNASVQRFEGDQPPMQTIRRIGAVVLIVAAIGVWFGMNPDSTGSASSHDAAISRALATDTLNNARTEGAPQQTVVNGWTAKDLLTIIAQEGSAPVDERPAALLTLLVIGFGLGLVTNRQPVRESPTNSPTAFVPLPAVPAPAASTV